MFFNKKKKKLKNPSYPEMGAAVSADATGLYPTPPANDDAVENYEDILDIFTQTENTAIDSSDDEFGSTDAF